MSGFIVIARGEDRNPARRILDELNEKHRLSGVLWSPQHYYDNEVQLTNKQPIICVGGPNANQVTGELESLCDTLYNENQIKIATKSNRWIVYGTHHSRAAAELFINKYLMSCVSQIIPKR